MATVVRHGNKAILDTKTGTWTCLKCGRKGLKTQSGVDLHWLRVHKDEQPPVTAVADSKREPVQSGGECEHEYRLLRRSGGDWREAEAVRMGYREVCTKCQVLK